MPVRDASTSILVLHDSHLNPLPFLQRLTADPNLSLEDDAIWHIDNKYYTASVEFDIAELYRRSGSAQDDGLHKGVPVVLYLFSDKPPDPLPLYLTRVITSEPRDIAIAVRVRPASSKPAEAVEGDSEPPVESVRGDEVVGDVAGETEWEAVEELFLELGMEVVDECAKEEEYTVLTAGMNPLEEVRMTIQTHMWPNMVRKPLGTRTAVDLDFGDDDMASGSGESSYGEDPPADFPTTFSGQLSSAVGQSAITPGAFDSDGEDGGGGDDDDGDALWAREWEGIPTPARLAAQAQFPSLETLNQQLAETARMFAQLKIERDAAMARQMERLDRLEQALNEDSDEELQGGEDGQAPADEEWARLENWMGEDGGEGDGGYEALGDDDDGEHSPPSEPTNGLDRASSSAESEGVKEPTGGLRIQSEEGEDRRPVDDDSHGLENWVCGYESEEEEGEYGGALDEPSDSELAIAPEVDADRPDASGPKPPPESGRRAMDEGFDDDFAGFHSAPAPPSSFKPRLNKNGILASLPMDPTPLLLHLQSVRAELAGVPDEDERRVRAAREVMAVLGLDMGEMGLEEDGDGELWPEGLRRGTAEMRADP